MTDLALIKFLELFAINNDKFVYLKKQLSNLSFFKDVTKHCGIYHSNRVEKRNPRASMGLDAELKIVFKKGDFSIDPLYSIGISFDIWKENQTWKLNGDVGMSRLHGFDNVESIEKDYQSINLLFDELEITIENMIEEFNKLVAFTHSLYSTPIS